MSRKKDFGNTRTCSDCGLVLPIDEFYKVTSTQQPKSICKKCENKRNKEWRLKNPGYSTMKSRERRKTKAYKQMLEDRKEKRKTMTQEEKYNKKVYDACWRYGITIEEYNKLPKYCECCGQTEGKLCIDHDHNTGEIRGVLCNNCNAALGMLKDNPILIKNLLKYVEDALSKNK